MKHYKTIYMDPPWFEAGGGKIKRGADKHYPLMKTAEIFNLPIRHLSDTNCHLYLWVTNNFLYEGLKAIERWGFVYKTTITWAKQQFGLGQYFRGQTEHCLFAVKGNLPYKTQDGKRCQGRTLLVPSDDFEKNRKHSEKPEEMRQMIELVSYEPRIELFTRKKTEGWDSWGNEVTNDINMDDYR